MHILIISVLFPISISFVCLIPICDSFMRIAHTKSLLIVAVLFIKAKVVYYL